MVQQPLWHWQSMIWLEVLLEGVSDVPAVKEVLERKFALRDGEHFRIHPHKGKGKLPKNFLSKPDPKHQGLLDQLPAKLRGFGKSLPDYAVVLVVIDVDKEPCRDVLKQLNSMLDALVCKPKSSPARLSRTVDAPLRYRPTWRNSTSCIN